MDLDGGGHVELLVGDWHGLVEVPSSPLRIRLHFTPGGGGTLDVPAQLAAGVPVTDVVDDDGSVRFAAPGLPGAPTFTGSRNGSSITGVLTQGGQDVSSR